MTPTERLTIDLTVARDLDDPRRSRHSQAVDLLALSHSGEVELELAPQGFRLDVDGALAARLRALLATEGISEAPQLAYASSVTYPSSTLLPGHYVPGFRDAWHRVVTHWASHEGKPPQEADSWHVESHVARRRDIFLSDDRALLVMCRRLCSEHSISIVAMGLSEYFDMQVARRANPC